MVENKVFSYQERVVGIGKTKSAFFLVDAERKERKSKEMFDGRLYR